LKKIINATLTKHFILLTIRFSKKHLWVYSLLLLFLLHAPLQAQKGVAITNTLHLGWFVNHNSKLTFKSTQPSIAQCVNLSWQTFGRRDWQAWQNYPQVGVGILHYELGNRTIQGDAFAIFPNITYHLGEDKVVASLTFGTGLAYLTKKYNAVTNPTFNAIGSHFNNITTIQGNIAYKVYPGLSLLCGASITHFSNGNSQIPNYGANIPAVSAGMTYAPQPVSANDYLQPHAPPIKNRWGGQVAFSTGLQEFVVVGGAKYPVYRSAANLTYQILHTTRLTAGMEYEFFKSVYDFGLHTYYFTSKEQALKRSSRVGVFFGDEVLMGDVSFSAQLGYYLTPINKFLPHTPIYTRFAMQYYLPTLANSKTRLFCGIYLKTHFAKAEYISFGLGLMGVKSD
jgi:hypothetical protein